VELRSIRTRPSCPQSAARCRAVKRCYVTAATTAAATSD